MDKVEDKTQVKRDGLDFDEDGRKIGFNETRVSETDLSYWEQQPPVAEVKIDSSTTSLFRSKGGRKSKEKLKYYLSIVAVAVTLVCVWIVFAIPQLCYFHVGICVQTKAGEEELQPIDLIRNCSGFPYTGTECVNYFGACPNSSVNVPGDNSLEADITTLFRFLDLLTLSDTCEPEKDLIKEFVCQYSYQPCDGDNNIIIPSRNVCEHLRYSACQSEWSILLNGQYGALLPKCGELPYIVPEPNCARNFTVSPSTAVPETNNNNNSNTTQNVTGSCGNVDYTGQVCSTYLDLCPDSQLSVNSFDSSVDGSLATLFSLFGDLSNDSSCKNSQPLVEEFLCQALFPPCDDVLFAHTPNRSHCEYIRDTLCPNDWMTLQGNLLAQNLLPNCSNLPTLSIQPSCTDVVPTKPNSSSSLSPTPKLDSLSLHCNEDSGFFLYITDDKGNSTLNNSCQARCSKWHVFQSQTLVYVDDASLILFTVIGLIGAVAVIVFSFVRHERMLIFPSIFIVYATIHLLILGVVLLVQYTDRQALSCAPDDLVVSTSMEPTIFCSFSGFIYFYSLLGLTYWWFMHVSSTFWKVMFPFHARNHEDKGKYIHIVCIFLGIIVTVSTPTIVFFIGGYSVNRYPPTACLPKNSDISYYGLILPVSLAISVGISFLVFVLHAILQKQRLFHFRQSKSHLFGLSTAEKKLLVVFIYYLVLGYVGIVGFAFTSSQLSYVLETIQANLECEAYRTDPDYECPREFEEIRIAIYFALVTYILLGLYPALNLMFAVNKTEVKVKLVNWFPSLFTDTFRSSTLSSSMLNGADTPFTLRRRLTYNFSATDHIKSSKEMATVGRSGTYLPKQEDNV